MIIRLPARLTAKLALTPAVGLGRVMLTGDDACLCSSALAGSFCWQEATALQHPRVGLQLCKAEPMQLVGTANALYQVCCQRMLRESMPCLIVAPLAAASADAGGVHLHPADGALPLPCSGLWSSGKHAYTIEVRTVDVQVGASCCMQASTGQHLPYCLLCGAAAKAMSFCYAPASTIIKGFAADANHAPCSA